MELLELQAMGNPEDALKSVRVKPQVSRSAFLSYLDSVIALAFEKVSLRNTTNSERISWCRVINGAVLAGTPLLRDVELDALKADVELIKKSLAGKQ